MQALSYALVLVIDGEERPVHLSVAHQQAGFFVDRNIGLVVCRILRVFVFSLELGVSGVLVVLVQPQFPPLAIIVAAQYSSRQPLDTAIVPTHSSWNPPRTSSGHRRRYHPGVIRRQPLHIAVRIDQHYLSEKPALKNAGGHSDTDICRHYVLAFDQGFGQVVDTELRPIHRASEASAIHVRSYALVCSYH